MSIYITASFINSKCTRDRIKLIKKNKRHQKYGVKCSENESKANEVVYEVEAS